MATLYLVISSIAEKSRLPNFCMPLTLKMTNDIEKYVKRLLTASPVVRYNKDARGL